MNLFRQSAEQALVKVRNLREEYRQYSFSPDLNKVSIADLVQVIGRMYTLTVNVRGVYFQGEYTRGMLLRYEHRADIFVRDSLDDALKRFTVVKELCHLVLDEPEDFSTRGVDTIGALQHDVRFDGVASRTSHSEALAEICAIEVMYPIECREADLSKKQFSAAQAAHAHGLPLPIVERALSSLYHSGISDVWDSVGRPKV